MREISKESMTTDRLDIIEIIEIIDPVKFTVILVGTRAGYVWSHDIPFSRLPCVDEVQICPT